MSADKSIIGRRLREERERRGWSRPQLAPRLRAAADPGTRTTLPDVPNLTHMIKEWEAGKHGLSGLYRRLYARAYDKDAAELFSGKTDPNDVAVLPLLLTPNTVGSPVSGIDAAEGHVPFTVEGVEAFLQRLYRLDAEFGGNELCAVAATQAQTAARLFTTATLNSTNERRLFDAMAGLTQIAGWLSIDANRHADANRYLTSTIYAAHEVDDLGLAGHALGYLSLHAFYRDQPKKALALAESAIGLADGDGTPRTRAVLHNRAARACARLGEPDRSRRHLDNAQATYARVGTDQEPRWTAYATDSELAAQRGACFLDLGDAADAIEALTSAIGWLQPHNRRDLAHYKVRLAFAYLLADESAAAVQAARDAHTIAVQVGSARVNEQLAGLLGRFALCEAPEVRDLLDEVTDR